MIRMIGTVSGLTSTLKIMSKIPDDAADAVHRGVRKGVLGGQSIVRGKASGRPGPRNVTGDFRRSIVGDSERQGLTVLGQIGTNAAQGRRLEYGFTGRDVLGRNYNQPPYPYLTPSIDEVDRLIRSLITDEIKQEFG